MSALQNAFENITSIDTLVAAHKKAMIGKRRNNKATTSNYYFMSELLVLQEELRNGSYQTAPYRNRIITEPKVRYIQAPEFRDRIVHHAIHSVLNLFYERHFIRDSYACRPCRGIHGAAARIQTFLRHSPVPLYVCKLDISKYYASINHTKLKQLLATKIDDSKLLNLLDIIIDSTDSGTEHDHLFPPDSYYHTKGPRGIPIGNLTSQLFANIYLHHADMYAKQQLKIPRYIRYMDDILIFHEDKNQLRIWQQAMTKFFYEELYLTINPHKIRVYPARLGVDFVGYIIFPHSMRLRGSSVRRFKKRYNKQLHRLLTGDISSEKLKASFKSWAAHAAHANTKQLTRSLKNLGNSYLFVYAVQKFARKKHLRGPKVQLSLFDKE
jgi:retron-type reverse transcriptase